MTKKTAVEQLDEVLNPVQTEDDKAYDRARQDQRDEDWRRDNALSMAISFHKNNGGMYQPQQLVDTATIFLSFLKGENK